MSMFLLRREVRISEFFVIFFGGFVPPEADRLRPLASAHESKFNIANSL